MTLEEYLDSLAKSELPLDIKIRALKTSLVISALFATKHSRAEAARLLDINRTTLVEMIKVIPEAAHMNSTYHSKSTTSRG
jgi:hypothetical protein